MSASGPTPGSSPWSGTLAAFAALGRIAFAAVPNVKPTTDIVLIAGYALGGAPGFAVGALAAPDLQLLLRPGTVDPVADGGLGRHRGARRGAGVGDAHAHPCAGRAGRWGAGRWRSCAARPGFAFTVVQDVGDWVTFSDHSLGQLGVYVGQGLGFDAVHAAGCLAFALALGPALTRSIQRFARRIKVTWIPAERVVAPLLLAALVLGALGTAGRAGARGGDVAAVAHLGRGQLSARLRERRRWLRSRPGPAVRSALRRVGGAGAGLRRARPQRRRRRPGPHGLRPRAEPTCRVTSARWSGPSSSSAPPASRRGRSAAVT